MTRSDTSRGIGIAVIMAVYAWFAHQPTASFTQMFLIGAGLQLATIVLRRFVPLPLQPQALEIVELLVDGATVLLFALGVLGGILRPSVDI